MTRAVTQALHERLERVRRRKRPENTAAELLAIGRRCAATSKGRPADHAALVYKRDDFAKTDITPVLHPTTPRPRPRKS